MTVRPSASVTRSMRLPERALPPGTIGRRAVALASRAGHDPAPSVRSTGPARQRERRRPDRVPVRCRMFGVTVRSQVGRSSQRACQPGLLVVLVADPGQPVRGRVGAGAIPVPSIASGGGGATGSSAAGRTATLVISIAFGTCCRSGNRPRPFAEPARAAGVGARPASAAAASARAGRRSSRRPRRGRATGSSGSRRAGRPPARTRAAWRPTSSRPPSGRRPARPGPGSRPPARPARAPAEPGR